MLETEAKEIYEELMKNNRGAKFEKLVERVTSPYYSTFPGYRKVLHDIYVPSVKGGLTQVDVVMIHENGIYVFECKDTQGKVYSNNSSKLWNYSNKLSSYRSLSPVEQNKIHIRALAGYLNLDEDIFKSWVVFSTFSDLHVSKTDNVTIEQFTYLSAALKKEINYSEVIFTPKEVDEIAENLERCYEVSYVKRLEHLKEVRGIGR